LAGLPLSTPGVARVPRLRPLPLPLSLLLPPRLAPSAAARQVDRALFQDQELIPIKGQLVFLLPQPEVDYMTIGPGDVYMFPRHDGILLGGTHDRGEWSMEPDPAATARILRENGALFAGMRTHR
jgi:glycine/D-amino acid oxidase-like deaminating enzyme